MTQLRLSIFEIFAEAQSRFYDPRERLHTGMGVIDPEAERQYHADRKRTRRRLGVCLSCDLAAVRGGYCAGHWQARKAYDEARRPARPHWREERMRATIAQRAQARKEARR